MNIGKSKILVSERGTETGCAVSLNGEMENVRAFKYLGKGCRVVGE